MGKGKILFSRGRVVVVLYAAPSSSVKIGQNLTLKRIFHKQVCSTKKERERDREWRERERERRREKGNRRMRERERGRMDRRMMATTISG